MKVWKVAYPTAALALFLLGVLAGMKSDTGLRDWMSSAGSLLEGLAAIVMLVFTFYLYRISQQQKDIMLNQTELTFDTERGRLTCDGVSLAVNRLGTEIRFTNIGRSPLQVHSLRYSPTNFLGLVSPGSQPSPQGGGQASTFTIPQGASETLLLPPFATASIVGQNPVPSEINSLGVQFLVYYTTLGRAYVYRWAWLFTGAVDGPWDHGVRFQLREYERDGKTNITSAEFLNDVPHWA